MVSLSLADDGLRKELECAICTDVMTAPFTFNCQHTFCSECVQGIEDDEEAAGSIRCPLCRKRSRREDCVGENKTMRLMCERAVQAHQAECPAHAGAVMDYYCVTCDEQICDRCALLGAHRGHEVSSLTAVGAETRAQLSSLRQTLQDSVDEAKTVSNSGCIDTVYEGLCTRVDEMAAAAIADIVKMRTRAIHALKSRQEAAKRQQQRRGVTLAKLNENLGGQISALPRLCSQAKLVTDAQAAVALAEKFPTWDAGHAADRLYYSPAFDHLSRVHKVRACPHRISCCASAHLAVLWQVTGASDDAPIQVFVDCGRGDGTLSFALKPSQSVGSIKYLIYAKSGFPVGRQNLYRGGKPLHDEDSVEDYRIGKGATIELRLFPVEVPTAQNIVDYRICNDGQEQYLPEGGDMAAWTLWDKLAGEKVRSEALQVRDEKLLVVTKKLAVPVLKEKLRLCRKATDGHKNQLVNRLVDALQGSPEPGVLEHDQFLANLGRI